MRIKYAALLVSIVVSARLFSSTGEITDVSAKSIPLAAIADSSAKNPKCLYNPSTAVSIKDNFGRTLILHGLNTAGGAKHSPDHQPWIKEKDVAREDSEFCFNAVRYLIFWGAIEPEKDVYDEAYLQQVKERVEWYTSRHMYVILDMHQDIYGYGVGGNGAPVWASTLTPVKNLISDKWAWWLQNLEPKVKRSYVEFFKYKKKKELQQHYITAWKKVIEVFKDNPYVIGYDLMNEPHGGNLTKTLFGFFEKRWLTRFYKRLIPAIRTADAERYIFFEPRSFGVNFGMKSYLKKVEDANASNPKLVYAPHCYPRFVDVGKAYNKKAKKELSKWFRKRHDEIEMHHTPALLGEFGLSPGRKDYDLFLYDLFRKTEDAHMSWTYWSGDPGGWGPLNADLTPSPILDKLLRVYPKATAGILNSYSFNETTRVFVMNYTHLPAIAQPTEIGIPRYMFPNGYDVIVEGTTQYTLQTNPVNNTVSVLVQYGQVDITITVKPR